MVVFHALFPISVGNDMTLQLSAYATCSSLLEQGPVVDFYFVLSSYFKVCSEWEHKNEDKWTGSEDHLMEGKRKKKVFSISKLLVIFVRSQNKYLMTYGVESLAKLCG